MIEVKSGIKKGTVFSDVTPHGVLGLSQQL
jgi:hypothetical protein